LPPTSSSEPSNEPRRARFRVGWLPIASAALGVVIVVGIAAWAVATSSDESSPPPTTAALPPPPPLGDRPRSALPGERAPEFTLPELDGQGEVSLAELRGQPVVVNFWASWCLPCRQEFPALAEAVDTYPDLAVIGIDFRDIPGDALEFAEEFDATWPLVEDEGGEVATEYGVRAIPQTVFIDSDGVVTDRIFAFTEEGLFSRIDALVAANG
jgi:cytochrome c biogenesis protein CcmG/thiol:disulfide interchange protein DsbE